MFNFVSTASITFFETCSRAWKAFEESVGSKQYFFYERNPAPYFYLSVNESGKGSAVPQWLYDTNTKTFTEFAEQQGGVTKPLPILSLEIMHKDKVLYDLTDFIEMLRVNSSDGELAPSIAHLLGAWSMHSGIVLDPERGFEVQMIDSAANTILVDSIHNHENLYLLLKSAEEALAEVEQEAATVAADAPTA